MVDDLLRTNLLHDMPNGHPYIAFAIFASVRLRRPAPTTIEQRSRRGDARSLLLAVARNAGKRLDRFERV
jgi:hypothetical protein